MDYISVIIPLFSALMGGAITVGLGAWVYRLNKNQDRRERLYDQKREAYAQFISDFTSVALEAVRNEDGKVVSKTADQLLESLAMVCLVAPDEVAKDASDAALKTINSNEKNSSVTKIAKKMRDDLILNKS